jgi:hypothetical protein
LLVWRVGVQRYKLDHQHLARDGMFDAHMMKEKNGGSEKHENYFPSGELCDFDCDLLEINDEKTLIFKKKRTFCF